MNPSVRSLWARTRLHVWPEAYVLASLPRTSLAAAAALVARSTAFAAVVCERDEVSLTLDREIWLQEALREEARSEDGPYRVITLDIDIDLEVVGYLAPAASLLAEAGISIVPQCAFLKDHLLIRDAHVVRAAGVLEGLIEDCRG